MASISVKSFGVSDNRLRELVREAEVGYDLPGAPAHVGPGALLMELPPELRAAVITRARSTGASAAEVIEALIRRGLDAA